MEKMKKNEKRKSKIAKFFYLCSRKTAGCSSARFRVRVWGARGRWFESSHPDKKQLVNMQFTSCF